MLLNYCPRVMKLIAPNSVGRRIMVDISSMVMATRTMIPTLILLMGFFSLRAAAQAPQLFPMNCTSAFVKANCQSYLYFVGSDSQTLSDIATNFNVTVESIFVPQQPLPNAYLVKETCTCNGDFSSGTAEFFANVPSPADENLRSQEIYGGLFYEEVPVGSSTGQTEAKLVCGCPIQDWSTMITYILQREDNLTALSTNFGSTVNDIQNLNGLVSDNPTRAGRNLFIPTKFTPLITATIEPRPPRSPSVKKSNGLVAGVISAVVVLFVLVIITVCLYWCKRVKNQGVYSRSVVEHSGTSLSGTSKEHSRRLGFLGNWFNSQKAKNCGVNNNVKRSITLPREAMDVFDQEKPIIFAYEEIIEATDNFKESGLLGQGSYGAVYYGILRGQNVAIKQMKTTKSREFYAELKVLCKVHHTNLVELLGYSAGDDSLVLIYEFAENGALSQHLHHTKGNSEDYLPLSWTARVQIALDTARGLEYIHDHTKAHYVHRDVKTSNILLDGFFRAKVADFGLAKLVEQNSETFITTTRVVGTFGYMPPEYIQGGHTTSKSDVYAFGVVLFQLVTGRPAMSKTDSGRRSVISFMLEVLREENDPRVRFQDVVDPRLGDCFPLELSFKMAKLARACVEEEPANRPAMRTVVFSLSQFLLNSVEWEAAFAGSSQIFSGLTQGR